jgi:TRAP-type C4-dicarboxylate transport system permease small subunit
VTSSGRGTPAVARLLDGMAAFEKAVTAAAFAVLVVVIFGDVVWRWTTGSGIFWAREVGVYANIVLTILGIGIASAQGAHLRPRFLDRVFPQDWDGALTRIQEALTAVAFAGLAWVAAQVVAETVRLDDRSVVLRWLVWPVQTVLPLAFGLGALRHALFAIWPEHRPGERGEVDLEIIASERPGGSTSHGAHQ